MIATDAWQKVRPLGIKATSLAMATAAGTGVVTAFGSATGSAPSLSAPFLMSGIALAAASALTWFELRPDLVELIVGGLTAGAFGITLAEMSAQAMTIPDHYKSLWVPMALASLLASHIVFRRQPAR